MAGVVKGMAEAVTKVIKSNTLPSRGAAIAKPSSLGTGVRAVRIGRQALPPPVDLLLNCLVLGSWLQRPAWDSDGGKSRALSNLLSLGTAPASAPQNLHAIRTDSGLILEWEEVIPEGPFESSLGPYKLSWVQDNGTQVREDRSLHSLGVSQSPLSALKPLASEWLSLVGLGGLGVLVLSLPQEAHSSYLPLQAALLIGLCFC